MLKKTLAMTAVLATAWLAAPLAAQTTDFPNKPVRIVVPFPPGGATDITARVVAEKLSTKWGQPVVIDNKAGAGGNVGSDLVAKSAPDGYNIVLGVTGSHSINISLYKKMPYHPLNDFEPLTQATIYPNAIVVNPQVPANTLPELIALLKKEPGKYAFGSGGVASTTHMSGELFKSMAGVNMIHVPFKGGAPLAVASISGEIPISFNNMYDALPHIRSGRLRGLAVTSATRQAPLPDVPTLAELGLTGYESGPWNGLVAPAKTPPEVISRLAAATQKIVREPAFQARMQEIGSVPIGDTPDQFRAYIQIELARWSKVVKDSGAKLD